MQWSDVERISFEKEMTEEEWKAACERAYPLKQYFRSTGKGGWINLMSIEGMPAMRRSDDDRWWTDCSPIEGPLYAPMNTRLIGTYNFSRGRGVGQIFYKLKRVETIS